MLKVVPLGGLGEVGLNTMLLEHSGERILIDCGLMFPSSNQPGVDIILPDFSALKDDATALAGIVLTHAHEDHLGALPYLLRDFRVPVYGTPFTLALARHRLDEAGIEAELRAIEPRSPFSIGSSFSVEAVRVTHSVPDAVGLAVKTPSATLIHSGDFKLDGMPVDGKLTDLERFGEIGDEGVSVLLSDSTNAEVPGTTGSEAEVRACFERLFAEATGRIIIALFGSHLHRVHHTLLLARQTSRRAAIVGRSLLRNFELAQSVGIVESFRDVLIPVESIGEIAPQRLVIVCTGAQAEPRSALSSMLSPEPGTLRIGAGDLIILSSRTIPGNEREVTALIDRILARGARVAYSAIEPGIHVSGHASRDEQRRLLETVRPKHFVPIHGELHHLHQHLGVAREVGFTGSSLVLMTDGDVVGFDEHGASTLGRARAGRVLMRRDGLSPIAETAISARRNLAENGVVVATVVMQRGSGQRVGGPYLQGEGLQSDEMAALDLATEEAQRQLDELSTAMRGDDERVREALVRGTRRVFKQLFGARPVVIPVVLRM